MWKSDVKNLIQWFLRKKETPMVFLEHLMFGIWKHRKKPFKSPKQSHSMAPKWLLGKRAVGKNSILVGALWLCFCSTEPNILAPCHNCFALKELKESLVSVSFYACYTSFGRICIKLCADVCKLESRRCNLYRGHFLCGCFMTFPVCFMDWRRSKRNWELIGFVLGFLLLKLCKQ